MNMCIGSLVIWSCGIYGGRRMQEGWDVIAVYWRRETNECHTIDDVMFQVQNNGINTL